MAMNKNTIRSPTIKSYYTIKRSHILNKPKLFVTGSTPTSTKDSIFPFSLDETNMKLYLFPISFIFNNIIPRLPLCIGMDLNWFLKVSVHSIKPKNIIKFFFKCIR